MTTLVIRPEDLSQHEVRVEGHPYRHLFRARRLRVGEAIRLVDGRGNACLGTTVEVKAKYAVIQVGEKAPRNEPARHLELVVPVPKASRLSWMVEKVTEVGVSAIHLIHAGRAPRQTGSRTLDRLRRVATAAVEQSHRSVVPVISGVHDFSEVPDLIEESPDRWFLHPGLQSSASSDSRDRVSLLVGPEGGWTDDEQKALRDWGCRPWALGQTVLRIETAAVVGSAGLLIEGFSR